MANEFNVHLGAQIGAGCYWDGENTGITNQQGPYGETTYHDQTPCGGKVGARVGFSVEEISGSKHGIVLDVEGDASKYSGGDSNYSEEHSEWNIRFVPGMLVNGELIVAGVIGFGGAEDTRTGQYFPDNRSQPTKPVKKRNQVDQFEVGVRIADAKKQWGFDLLARQTSEGDQESWDPAVGASAMLPLTEGKYYGLGVGPGIEYTLGGPFLATLDLRLDLKL